MPPADPRERITIYLPTALKADVDRDADARGQTVSTWVARACKQRLAGKMADSSAEARQ